MVDGRVSALTGRTNARPRPVAVPAGLVASIRSVRARVQHAAHVAARYGPLSSPYVDGILCGECAMNTS
jgi:hypothetical protein